MTDTQLTGMHETLELSLAGEAMVLHADRALYWPARRRLLIADLHLGKGDVFRSAGISVPSGGTAHDLGRLRALLARTRADSLWILGDFLHGARTPAVDAAWRAFRSTHAAVRMAVVRGNHDRAFDADIAGVDALRDGVEDGPFGFRHAPPEAHNEAQVVDQTSVPHIICGHLHPVVRLPGAGAHPLFWLRDHSTILPAFSRFTGGYRLAARDCAGSVICNGQSLLQLR